MSVKEKCDEVKQATATSKAGKPKAFHLNSVSISAALREKKEIIQVAFSLCLVSLAKEIHYVKLENKMPS